MCMCCSLSYIVFSALAFLFFNFVLNLQVPDGVNVIKIGKIGSNPSTLALTGGNCSLQGFDIEGNDSFWTVSTWSWCMFCLNILIMCIPVYLYVPLCNSLYLCVPLCIFEYLYTPKNAQAWTSMIMISCLNMVVLTRLNNVDIMLDQAWQFINLVQA